MYFLKGCPSHAVQKTKVAAEAHYYVDAKTYLKPGDRSLQLQSETDFGCPCDCGLCLVVVGSTDALMLLACLPIPLIGFAIGFGIFK